jgi:hypothetical protein
MNSTHGTNPFEGMNPEELADAIIGVILGDREAQSKVADAGLRVIENDFVAKARRFQVETGETHALHFGPEAKAYVKQTIKQGPGSAEGLVLAMLELVLRREREVRAALNRTTGTRTDLDFAAIEAERDDALARAEKAERDRGIEAGNARTADRNLREANATIAVMTGQLRTARERGDRVPELEATILRMDQELIEVNGRLADAEEALSMIKGEAEASRS